MEKVLLITVSNDFEADMYESILSSCDIEIYKRVRNSAKDLEVYLGRPNMGVEIYVSENQYEEAKAVLNDSDIDYESIPLSDENEGKIKNPYWIIPVSIIIFIGYFLIKWTTL